MSSDNAKKYPLLSAVPNTEEDFSITSLDQKSNEVLQTCPLCFGTGYEVVPGKGARRCECRKQSPKEKLIAGARIPRRYSGCTLDNYFPEQGNGTQVKALMKARELANNYHSTYRQQGRGLLFMGPVGVGKTHLAVAILNKLIDQGVECLFYEFGALLKSIQDSYNPISHTSELRVLAPVYEAEVLVLDELASTVPTDWVRDTISQIINRRYNDKRVTIFTTNYMDEVEYTNGIRDQRVNPVLEKVQNDIAAILAQVPTNEAEKKTLERRLGELRKSERQIRDEIEVSPAQRIQKMTKLDDRIGLSMRSRLYEMCETIVVKGTDYRRKSRRQDI